MPPSLSHAEVRPFLGRCLQREAGQRGSIAVETVMGVFDRAARYATQADQEAVVRRLRELTALDLRFREWADTRTTPMPEERDQTADRVAVLAEGERLWLGLLEFQARHDEDKIDDMLAEVGLLRRDMRHGEDRKGKYLVLPVLIYLTGVCPDPVLDMTAPGGLGTRHAPVVWNVGEDDAGEAVAAVEDGRATWGLLFFVPLTRGGGEPAHIARWRELAALLPDPRQRSDLGSIALVFAELAGHYLAWEKGLEGWQMTESQVVNRWIEQSQLKEDRELLIKLLQRRFPDAVPQDVIEAIQANPSRPLLLEWFDIAATAANPDEFIAYLRR